MATDRLKFLFSEWVMGGLLTLIFLVGYLGDWKVFRTFEYLTYDLRAHLRENPKPSDQIVIVGVDDDSITKVGRWPWPRSVVATVIDKLREAGALTIGVAFLYSEPEQTGGVKELQVLKTKLQGKMDALSVQAEASPKTKDADLRVVEAYREVVDDLRGAEERLDQDAKLADTIAKTPQVVLPMFFEIGKPLGNETEDPPAPILANAIDEIENPRDLPLFPLVETKKLTPPLPAFQHEGVALGHINIRPDEDGVVRRELLLLEYRNHFYPSFALRAVSAYLKVPAAEQRVTLGRVISVGALQVPTDALMRMRVSFNGPAGTFKAISAADVLEDKISPETFKGKLVIVGPLATGIADRNVTPVAPAISGVEVVANVVENLLEQNFVQVPGWAPLFELGMLIVVGAFLVAGLPRLGALMAGIVAGVLLVGYVGVAAVAFAANGAVVTIAHPALLLVFGYTIITSKRFLVTEKKKELVEADSIETNKMLGLSFQGQGMLDLAFEKFQKCPLDDSVKGLLYNLGLDFERKRMFNKAVAVYEHIGKKDTRYKDIEERIKKLQAVGETMIFGAGGLKKGASPDATVVVEGGGVKPTLGRYEVVKELGRGAMGIVYLGQDPKIRRNVAIKTMRLDEVDPDQLAEVKERFFREAESAGRLNHPNIVTIFDAGEEQELAYIAMEVLEGVDLKDYCKKDTLLSVKQTLDIVAKVADALDYAHSQSIVHRDIKPANIMLMKDGTPKVTDFGIARITSSSKTQTGVVLGTPSYMSPEQLAGTKVDGRSDLFSLGVVLYEMLTGEKPFQGDSVATLMFQIANAPHQSPLKIRPDLPAGCDAIIDRALQKDLTKRYQRGNEMAQDIRACLQSL
jgi:serine/threonine-protein kinase